MKTFVIGDVHGSFKQFQNLLEVIHPNLKHDRLVMLGDYIDRGPNSYLMVKTLIELEKKYGRNQVVLLRGNHEQMAIDHCQHRSSIFLGNGGEATLRDFRRNGDDLANVLPFFQSLRTYFQDDHFIYVHGGIRHGIPMARQQERDLLWIRDEFYNTPNTLEKTVIFGHTPTLYLNNSYQPFFGQGCIGIDTACVFGGRLSALELHNGQVKAIHQTKAIAA